MTEAEWLAFLDPETMTGWKPEQMLQAMRGQIPERGMRVFACACCRELLWHLLQPQSRRAIDVVEAYVDGHAGVEDLWLAQVQAQAVVDQGPPEREEAAAQVAVMAASEGIAGHLTLICRNTWYALDETAGIIAVNTAAKECALIHCLLGNPFRPVRIDPTWLAWNDGTIRRIAERIYQDRAFDRLPILADALLDAGCDDEQLLEHCRAAGPHARGCWVVDALTGRS